MPDHSSPAGLTVTILHCNACGANDPGPRDLCPVCHSADLAPREVGGAGRLVAATLIRRPPAKFKADGAYGIAIVELDAGVRVVGRVDSAPGRWHPGDRVAVIARHTGYDVFGKAPS